MKKIITTFLIVISFFCSFAQQPSLRVKVQKNIFSSDTLKVSIQIQNADISDVARLVQIIPSNFIFIKGHDLEASTFFSHDSAKFIWTLFPNDKKNEIIYFLKPTENISGKFEIGKGSFSYLSGNKIKDIPFKSQKITVNQKLDPSIPSKLNKDSIVTLTNQIQTNAENDKFSMQTQYLILLFLSDSSLNVVNVDDKLMIQEPIKTFYYDKKFYYFVGNYISINEALKQKEALSKVSQFDIKIVKMTNRIPEIIEDKK